MKFLNALLSLAAASTVLSFNVNLRDGLYLTDSSIAADEKDPLYEKFTKECQEDLDKTGIYSDCIDSRGFNLTTFEDRCKVITSQKCVKFGENPLADLPKCTNDPVFTEYANSLKGHDPKKNIYCLRSAEGKLCPTVNAEITNGSFTDDDVSETCKSKACTEGLIKTFELSIQNSESTYKLNSLVDEKIEGRIITVEESNKAIQYFIDLLKSSNCTSQAKDDTATTTYIVADEKSCANSIKISSILFTTLSLALAYLL